LTHIILVPGTDNNPLDGVTRGVYEISRRISNKDFNVINLVPSKYARYASELVDNVYYLVSTPVSNLNSFKIILDRIDPHVALVPYFLNYKEAVRKLLKTIDDQIILHTFAFYTLTQPRRECNLIKRVSTLVGFGQFDFRAKGHSGLKVAVLNSLLKQVYSNADVYTTFDENMKSTAIELYGLKDNKVSIVPHGVDAVFFASPISIEQKEEIEKRYRLNKPIKVLFLGRLVKGKGLNILLRAFRFIKEERKDIMLILKIGAVRHLNEIMETILEWDLEDYVRVITDRLSAQDLRAIYKVSDMFVNYFLVTGHSTALLEAMASGTPPLIYKNSSCSDIVAENCGVLLETLDPTELSKVILMLADDSELLKKMGENAKNEVLKKYDWDKAVVPKYVELYKSLI
jgi:glycosyltransferase involved in cell wall biosynthesis